MPLVVMYVNKQKVAETYHCNDEASTDVAAQEMFNQVFEIIHPLLNSLMHIEKSALVPQGEYFGKFTSGRLPLEIEIHATKNDAWDHKLSQKRVVETIRDRVNTWLNQMIGFEGWKCSVWLKLTEGNFVE